MSDQHAPDELLKNAKLKITEQRRKILEFLLSNHGPFTVEEMAQKLKSQGFDLATIYRSMGTFEEAGLVEKRLFGDSVIRWEMAAHTGGSCAHDHHGHHHHLMCTECKKIIQIDVCLPPSTQQELSRLGYADLKHHLEFSGICPQCQVKRLKKKESK
ncbi:MAG: transcriptional repressor [Bacteriovoracaceae bacterium]|nr:transcriptional repressor [Bacteriovoracaceae bacterium]